MSKERSPAQEGDPLDHSRLVNGEPCYRCGKIITARLSHMCKNSRPATQRRPLVDRLRDPLVARGHPILDEIVRLVNLQTNEAADRIEELERQLAARSERAESAWIPVSESPPKLHQHCLIWIDGATVPCIGTLNKKHAHTYGSEIFYYFALGNGAGERAADKVSHWMPLPEATNVAR